MSDLQKFTALLESFGITETTSHHLKQSFNFDLSDNTVLVNSDGRLRRVVFYFDVNGKFLKLG